MYEPLQPGQIRLLRPIDYKSLDFELVCCDLNTAPRYVAVSYRCGDIDPTCNLRVNDTTVSTSLNLRDALQHVVTYAAEEKLHVWADAICISQNNLDERSHQVLLMRQIYEKARKVYAWLGWPKDIQNMELAFQLMSVLRVYWLNLYGQDRPTDDEFTAAVTALKINGTNISDVDTENNASRAWTGILELFDNEWWCRTWIYQEASTPESTDEECRTYFLYGSYAIDLDGIEATFKIATHLLQTDFSNFVFQDQANTARLLAIGHLVEFRDARRNDLVQFLPLLRRIRWTFCTDPRDKIYVPLGLSCDVEPGQLTPNYNCDIDELMIDVAKFFLQNLRCPLDILGEVNRATDDTSSSDGEKLRSFPTWVSHMTFQTYLQPIPKSAGHDPYADDYSHGGPRLYNADAGKNDMMGVHGQCLHVHGIRFDVVHELSPIPSPDFYGIHAVKEWRPTIRPNHPLSDKDEPYISTAISRCLTLDLNYTHNIEPSRNQKVDGAAIPIQLHMPSIEQDDTEAAAQKAVFVAGSIRTEDDIEANTEKAFLFATFQRRLCVTKSGSLGLVPNAAREGDVIAVLFSGQVLYVLRPLESTEGDSASCPYHDSKETRSFEFVGECYIDGFMDGEAVRDGEEGTCIKLV